MNKKFSTLVASVLLAGAVGTVGAVVPYNSYVKSAGLATAPVQTVVNGVAYQIAEGGKVLVMTEQRNGTMKLEMVEPNSADLLSSLWEVGTSDDGEGGISFIFLNKATGLPLAFATEGVKENATTTNALGNVSLWKWKSGASVAGPAKFVSYFHKDSAMVLVNNGDVIGAKKIFAKNTNPETTIGALSANAYVAQPVYLNADALNTMLGLQDLETGKMKLGFTRDQLNGSDNLWLKDMKAVSAVGTKAPAISGAEYYSVDEKAAATKAVEVAKATDVPQTVVDAIEDGISNDWDEAVKNWANGEVKGAAFNARTFAEAKAAAEEKITIKDEAVKAAVAAKAVADADKEIIDTWPFDAVAGVNNNATEINNVITGVDNTALDQSQEDPFEKLFTDAVTQAYSKANTPEGLTAAKQAVSTLKDQLDAIENASASVKDQDTYTVWLETPNVPDDVKGILTPLLNGVYDQVTVNDKIALLKAAADKINTAVANLVFTAQEDALTRVTFVTKLESLVADESGVKEDLIAVVEGLPETVTDVKEAKKFVDQKIADYATVAEFVQKVDFEAAITALKDALESADSKTPVVEALTASKADLSTAQDAIIDQIIAEISSTESLDAAIAAVELANTEIQNGIKSEGTSGSTGNYLSLITKSNDDAAKIEYLRVDTAFLTKDAGKKHLAFATGVHKAELKNSNKLPVASAVQADYDGRYNFQFTYYPSQDSLMIEADGFAHPRTDKYYADMTDAEIADSRALHAADNYVKLAVLSTDKHHEVTLGDIETIETSKLPTINTRIYLNGSANYERTTLASGVYFFSLVTEDADKMDDNGKYRVAQYCGDQVVYEAIESTQRFGTAQDFNHMPRTQWVVEQNEGVIGEQTVNIVNREFPAKRYNNVQLYKAGDDVFAQIGAFSKDTLAYAKVADQYTTDKYLGYKKFVKAEDYEKFYNLDYLSGIELGNYVNFNADSAVYVDLKDGKTFIEFVPVTVDTEFGYASTKAKATQLYKAAYQLRVHSETLLTTGDYYVTVGKDGKSYVVTSSTSGIKPSNFVLKENNELISEEGDTTCYYALQQVNLRQDEEDEDVYYVANEVQRVGVRDASMAFTTENSCYNAAEKRIATFAVVNDKTPLYRRLGETLENDGFQDMTVQNAKVYTVNSAAKEYLYEDAYSKYSKDLGINFLGLEDKGVTAKSAMFVDTAYVRGNTNMPQYMFVMNPQIVKADTIWCNATSTHKHATLADSLACPHTTITPASVTGRYLINAQDSVNAGDKNYVWNSKYTRLAFVDAKHIGDTLVIFRNGKPSTAKADSIFLGNNNHNKDNAKNPVFALRLVNTDACDFLIETAGDHKIPSDGTGKWVAIKNGVPVVAAYETYKDAIRDAEIFNIEPTEEIATSNDAITTGGVLVVAGDAKVIIKGAAGKTVVISNLLGQTIANEAITSDNAEIAAPAGVVVVAIEGEAAVKAIVK